MELSKAIEERRALRSLGNFEVTPSIIKELTEAAKFAPSCFNNQPWRYLFVYEKEKLKEMRSALSKGNEWAYKSPLIVAVLSKEDLDCVIAKRRKYYQFDTGISAGFMMLKATEMGLVAHPIAGYSPKNTRKILNIPKDMKVITLIVFGKKMEKPDPELSDKMQNVEKNRPQRLPQEKFVFKNTYEQ